MTCADYFTKYPFTSTFITRYSYNIQINIGFNKFILPQPVIVTKGYFLYITQNTGVIAVDQSQNSSYSDLVWDSVIWSKISEFSNWRLYLNLIINSTSYQAQFNLLHTYNSIGIYNLTITYASSNDTYQIPINITDCNMILIFRNFEYNFSIFF